MCSCTETLGAECWSGLAALCSEFRKGWASASDTDAQTVAVSATANLGDAASGVGAASPSSFLGFHVRNSRGESHHSDSHCRLRTSNSKNDERGTNTSESTASRAIGDDVMVNVSLLQRAGAPCHIHRAYDRWSSGCTPALNSATDGPTTPGRRASRHRCPRDA